MLVKIRIKPERLKDIQKRPRSMHLGNDLIIQDWQELDIPEKHLQSIQCKHWLEVMPVDHADDEKPKRKAGRPKKEKVEE